MPRPFLWERYSEKQVYITALEASSPKAGPAISFAGHIPDKDHYKGSFNGRVYPLWRNADATIPNIKPALLAYLSTVLGRAVPPEDVMAYIAAIMAHPGFTERFKADLVRPGLRVPLTADAGLFARTAALGREVIWLHTYGERFADPDEGRRYGTPRLPSPLNDIQPDHWLAEYTEDLINLLDVLGRLVKLEPKQAALLEEVLEERLLDQQALSEAGALSESAWRRVRLRAGENAPHSRPRSPVPLDLGRFAVGRIGAWSNFEETCSAPAARATFSARRMPSITRPSRTKCVPGFMPCSPRCARRSACRGIVSGRNSTRKSFRRWRTGCRRRKPRSCALSSRPSWPASTRLKLKVA
jgi:hypothetical protein